MTEVTVWSGWVGGVAVGLYLVIQYALTGRPLSCSTGYGNLCAYASRAPFFRSGSFVDRAGWRLWFTLGLPLGGALAALTSEGSMQASFSMGQLYDSVLPAALWARALWLLVGGIMIGYGARMAGGCTSGHAITGISLRNAPSLWASVGFFVGGTVAVQLLFRLVGGIHG